MRAPRARRWGLEPIWGAGAGAGAGRRAGEKGQGGKKGGRPLQASSPLSHPLTHPNVHSSGNMYVQGRASPLTHTRPWMQGFRPRASRSDKTRSHRVTSLKFLSPVLPARCGQLSWAGVHRGLGSYCTVS